MERDASLTVRVTQDLKQALAAAAKRDGRTTSNLVERILSDWLRAQPKRR